MDHGIRSTSTRASDGSLDTATVGQRRIRWEKSTVSGPHRIRIGACISEGMLGDLLCLFVCLVVCVCVLCVRVPLSGSL